MTKILKCLVIVVMCQVATVTFTNLAYSNDEIGCHLDNNEVVFLNGPELLEASETCSTSSEKLTASFLYIIGHIRLVTDLALFFPSSDIGEIKISKLEKLKNKYVDMTLYRDTEFAQNLIDKIENWKPEFSSNYNPGWKTEPLISASVYHDFLRQNKDRRIAIIRNQERLIQRDDFYAIMVEIRSIFERNNHRVHGGTEDFSRIRTLRRMEREISKQVRKPLPKVMYPHPSQFAPPSKVEHSVLMVGTNGPNFYSFETIMDRAKLEKSWLPKVLTRKQMADIRDVFDFQRQHIIAIAYGQRTDLTAGPYFYHVSRSEFLNKIRVVSGLGQVGDDCQVSSKESYPFAVIAIDPVAPNWKFSASYKNFNDGCKSPLTDSPGYELEVKIRRLNK